MASKINFKVNSMEPVSRLHDIPYDKYFKEEYVGFRTVNGYFFKELMNFIASVTNIVNLKITSKGIYISTMDNSHVALIDCLIPKELFNILNHSNEKNDDELEDTLQTTWGINMESFTKILGQLNRNDELIIYQEKENSDTIHITYRNNRNDKYYKMNLLNIETDELSIFDMPDRTVINIQSKYLNDIIKDLSIIGETIKISMEQDENNDYSLWFYSESDITSLKINIHWDKLEVENIQLFNEEYCMKNILIASKGHMFSSELKIYIGEDIPIQFSYNIMTNGYINYYLAPKMKDE